MISFGFTNGPSQKSSSHPMSTATTCLLKTNASRFMRLSLPTKSRDSFFLSKISGLSLLPAVFLRRWRW